MKLNRLYRFTTKNLDKITICVGIVAASYFGGALLWAWSKGLLP